jgi:hypothetical protein
MRKLNPNRYLSPIRRAAVCCLFGQLFAVGSLVGSQTIRTKIDDEKYSVFSAALQHFSTTVMGAPSLLLIVGETTWHDNIQAALDEVRHPTPMPQVRDPALTRRIDPDKVREKSRWLKEHDKRILLNPADFAQQISKETIVSWVHECYKPAVLQNAFKVSAKTIVITAEDWQRLGAGEEKSYRDFRKKFLRSYGDNAVIELSGVGFNNEHTQAVVEIGYVIPDRVGGEGYFLLLEKGNDTWKVRCALLAWLS